MDMVPANHAGDLRAMYGRRHPGQHPGEAVSVDARRLQMARQGRAGPALGMSAFGSFIGGTVSVVAVMLISPFLAEAALKFGPPEMFALLFFAFTCIGGLTGKSRARGLLMACVGLLLGTVGTDDIQGVDRFVFGTLYLRDGIGLVPLAMGLFGLGEIIYNIERRAETGSVLETPKNLLPTLKDWKDSAWPIARGSVLGFGIGILRHAGGGLAHELCRRERVAKRPEEFGHGAMGVAVRDGEQRHHRRRLRAVAHAGIPTNSVRRSCWPP
jgi:putative tricarboxylic transport membrane protein